MPRWTRKNNRRTQRFFGGDVPLPPSGIPNIPTGPQIPPPPPTTPPSGVRFNNSKTKIITIPQRNKAEEAAVPATTNAPQPFDFKKDLFEQTSPNLDFAKVKDFVILVFNEYEKKGEDRFMAIYQMYRAIAYLILTDRKGGYKAKDVAELGDDIHVHLQENFSRFIKVGHDKTNAMVLYNDLSAYLWLLYVESIRQSLLNEEIVELKPTDSTATAAAAATTTTTPTVATE